MCKSQHICFRWFLKDLSYYPNEDYPIRQLIIIKNLMCEIICSLLMISLFILVLILFIVQKGFSKLPVCMAKTSNSLTADPTIKGAPVGFKVIVNDIFISAGAGFVVVICGDISKMPGLPTRPCFFDMDLSETGEIEGLF